MNEKEKSFLWWLTFPFAHPINGTFTTLWNTVYMPKGYNKTPDDIYRHEIIHSEQQKRWGLILLPFWVLCYLGLPMISAMLLFYFFTDNFHQVWPMLLPFGIFGLPFFYNPFRYRWEYEAFIKGSKISPAQTREILSSFTYGFLFSALNAFAVVDIQDLPNNS